MTKPKAPRFSRILDWLEGRLSEDEARTLSEQMFKADDATRADLAWLRSFQQTAQSVKLASPPPQVRDVLKRRFQAYSQSRETPSIYRRLLAKLTFDSRAQPRAAGLRSAAAEGLQRQLVYTTEVAEIALNIQPQVGGQHVIVTGQVFPARDEALRTFSLQFLRGALEVGLVTTDDLGEFAFDALPAGEYDLVVSADQFEVVIMAVPVRV